MKKTAFEKNNRREIKRTLGRYMAIFAIIALGVGFLSGLKVTRSAMVKSADAYLTETNMYDFRLVSTMGLTDEDVDYFSGRDYVKNAEGSISLDFLTQNEDGTQRVLKAMMLGSINSPKLVCGRMPASPGECLADKHLFKEDSIGQTIKLSEDNDESTKDMFAFSEYTIVGLCDSPLYMNNERGTTSLKGGAIAGFVCIPEEGFSSEVYTDIYLTADVSGEIFSDEYEDGIDRLLETVEDDLEYRANERYTEIVNEANEKLVDGEKEYEDGYREYTDGKKEAEEELAAAKQELDDAAKKLADAKAELISAEAELSSGENKYSAGLAEYNKKYQLFLAEKDKAYAELEESQAQINEGKQQALDGIHQIEDTGVIENYEQLTQAKAALEEQLSALEKESPEYAAVYAQYETVNSQIQAIEDTGVIEKFTWLTNTVENLDNSQLALDEAKAQAEESFAQAQSELDSAKAELDSARAQLDSAKRKTSSGWTEYENGLAEYNNGLAEYEQAKKDAQEEFEKAEKELDDAKKELDDARKEIADIKKPDTYVLDRNTNTGYVCFDNDSAIVESIAKVFPVFFFVVAALVCVTTMTRMVDDQRTQIGTLKALGYSNGSIIWKYVSYSGSAAVLGCAVGFFVGSWLFPKAIWTAYKLLYGFGEISTVFDVTLGIISLVAALVCSAGATFAACRKELGEMPAELMRPKAPTAGKRIFLEKIPFIWHRMTFLHKVTARNIFRYKKRLFMMILGISGCTALVLTGLGLRDSICNIAEDQFQNIMKYDYTISFAEEQSQNDMESFVSDTSDILSSCVFVCGDATEIDCGDAIKSANVIATSDPEITNIIDLHDGKTPIAYPEDGTVAVSRKLADSAGAGPGDKITIRTDGLKSVEATVSGVFDNYVFGYIMMTEETYSQIFDKPAEYNTAYGVSNSGDYHTDAATLVNEHGASSVSVTMDLRERISKMLDSMNYIVMLVIFCAGALAFIVLFNLSNINITERQREIATIKVLGFYPGETGAYVFRENFVLAAMGTVLGLGLGNILHRYVMSQVNIDMVSFDVRITPLSYVLGVVITFAFTVIVDIIMRRKLEKINMAESLKAIE